MKTALEIFLLFVGMVTFPTIIFIFGLSTWTILLGLFTSTFLLTTAMLRLAKND